MLNLIVIVSLLAFGLIIPLIVVYKYYSPKQYSIFMNIIWIALAIISWPLIPLIMASRRHDKILLSAFWLSFLIAAVSCWYWAVLNINSFISFLTQVQGTQI